jgi:hypothetical protein
MGAIVTGISRLSGEQVSRAGNAASSSDHGDGC